MKYKYSRNVLIALVVVSIVSIVGIIAGQLIGNKSGNIFARNLTIDDCKIDSHLSYPSLYQSEINGYDANVKHLQTDLLTLGYSLPKYGADGYYGDEVVLVVAKFKADSGLSGKGTVFSQAGWAKLAEKMNILVRATPICTDLFKQPNVIVFMTDDMRYDELEYMTYVNSLITTKGANLTQAMATSPLCCPSRASFLSGKYVHNHHVLDLTYFNGGGHGKFYENDELTNTIALHLNNAGYTTALFGKYLNHYPDAKPVELKAISDGYVPPGWDDWNVFYTKAGLPNLPGGGLYTGYYLNQNGAIKAFGNTEEEYSTDVLTGQVLQALDRYKLEAKPFFVFLSFYAPHNPADPAPRHVGSTVDRVKSPSYNEAEIADKPTYVRSLPLITSTAASNIAPYSHTTIRNNAVKRLRSLKAVDEAVKKVVDKLKTNGTLDNTYLVFTSDQGYMLGEHRIPDGKRVPYEEAVRTPLVISGPGILPGITISNSPVSLVDMVPTVLGWSGTKTAYDGVFDGVSLFDLLRTPSQQLPRKYVLIEQKVAKKESETYTSPAWDAVRSVDYIYIEYESGEEELYNLKTDPYQMTNLANNSSYASVKKVHKNKLTQMLTCAGLTCR